MSARHSCDGKTIAAHWMRFLALRRKNTIARLCYDQVHPDDDVPIEGTYQGVSRFRIFVDHEALLLLYHHPHS